MTRKPRERESLVISWPGKGGRGQKQHQKKIILGSQPASLPGRGVINTATASAWWRLPFQEASDTPPHVDYTGAVNVAAAAAAEGCGR